MFSPFEFRAWQFFSSVNVDSSSLSAGYVAFRIAIMKRDWIREQQRRPFYIFKYNRAPFGIIS